MTRRITRRINLECIRSRIATVDTVQTIRPHPTLLPPPISVSSIKMDSDQAGPSRPHQPVLRLREAETELDPEILSGLLAHYNFDDTKLSGAAIINQEVNGIFDDLEQMKGLLLEMKGWKAEDVMQGFESAYTAVEHAINRVSMVAEEVGEEVACALRTSLRDLRE